jgi:hypothetical protein
LFWLRRLGSLHERLVGRARRKKRQQGGSHHCPRTTTACPEMAESAGRSASVTFGAREASLTPKCLDRRRGMRSTYQNRRQIEYGSTG